MRTANVLSILGALALWPAAVSAQINVTGVADKTTYNNTVTFTVGTQAGFDYNATLNWKPIATGVPVVVNKADFYELRVDATNQVGGAVTSLYRRFIVIATERAATEWGLPPHTPFPVIQSSSNEFAGARLRVLAPTDFPTGYEIPIVAWVVDQNNHAVRANGLLSATGQNPIQLKRGTGSGFLASNQPPGTLNYSPSVGGVMTNKSINLETNTAWSNVSGLLSGTTTWPDQSRIRVTGHLLIPAGSTLNIGAGSIVLLNAGVNITNNGAVVINGSVEQPVLFMPNSRSQPWGGFFMRTGTGSLNATGAIFVASGADPSGGAGHRPEQCLFLVDSTPTLTLVDSAAIYLAGQMGHAFNGGTFTFTRFLMQRATTGGEYTGSTWRVNDSAFIECPDDTVNFVDGDNDALYFVSGSQSFTNTLFGWTKDDGVDSGGSGYGPLTYESCWFEGTFHEGNSLSGFKNVYTRGTVYFDCGQGIEGGYESPTSRVDSCFFSMCQSGIRHGDNYSSMLEYTGPMTATNNISIYNYRDLFGFNWDSSGGGGWTNNWRYFFASNNVVSTFDTNYPNNTLWNPATDGWRLAAFGAGGRVGVGFGARGSVPTLFGNGLPVGLSRFCTNEVRVDYAVESSGGLLSNGTLVFPAGLTRHYIPVPTNLPGFLRVKLSNPVNADITSNDRLYLLPPSSGTTSTNLMLLPRGTAWNYWDAGTDLGTGWRAPGYNDGSWSNGLAQLGFGDSPADEVTRIRRTDSSSAVITTFYFRRAFYVTNAAAFTNISMWMLRDDGGVVYLNGTECYRSPTMPQLPTVINFQTFATNQSIPTAPPDNTIDTATLSAGLLVDGTNVAAVEIHQHDSGSSDASFDFELNGILLPTAARLFTARFADDLVLMWSDPSYRLEEAEAITGPWRLAATSTSPSGSAITGTKFFRLRR